MNILIKVLFVFALVSGTHLPLAKAQQCLSYFNGQSQQTLSTDSKISIPSESDSLFSAEAKVKFLDQVLSLETPPTPVEWVQILRYINESPESFPFAEKSRFGKFWSRNFKLPEYKRHLFALFFRGSHVDLPKSLPQDKKELAEFLIAFAHQLELQLANRNSFSFPLDTSITYINSRLKSEQKILEKMNLLKASLEAQNLPRTKKYLLQLQLVIAKIKSVLKINWFIYELKARGLKALPHNYAKDVEFILNSYDRDIQILAHNLNQLLNLEINKAETKTKKLYIEALKGFFNVSLKPFLQFSFWEPHRHHSLDQKFKSPWTRPIFSFFKSISDTSVVAVRFMIFAFLGSTLIQSTTEVIFIHSLYNEAMKQIAQNQPQTTQEALQRQLNQIDLAIQKTLRDLNENLDPSQREKLIEDLESLRREYEKVSLELKAIETVNTP